MRRVWSARYPTCFARYAVISHLCRLWVCKGGFVLITDCRWPLLLPNIYSSLDIERERPWSCPVRSVYLYFCVCGANGRIRERGFGDWRIGGLVTVERGGYMRFYESMGEGFVLFSCEAFPRTPELPKATEIRSEAARPLRIYPHSRESRRFPMPDTISKHRWQLTRNAYVMRKDIKLLVEYRS